MHIMIKILLVRHGQTVWNLAGKFQGKTDVELTEDGLRQAQMLADRFPVDRVDEIYCSDLKRAHDTAKAIGAKFGVAVIPSAELREINFGEWESLTYQEICAKWPENMEDFWKNPAKLTVPGGETFLQVQQRAMRKIEEIIAANDTKEGDRYIVIVAHGGINRSILAGFLGMPINNVWRISQYNTAVNSIRIDDGMVTVEYMNNVEHISNANIQPSKT